MDAADEDPELEGPADPELGLVLPAAALAYEAGAGAPLSRAERRRVADRAIVRLAWPAVISQLLIVAVSVIDLTMVGRLGTEAIAISGYTSQYYQLAQAALFGLSVACVALMSRALGAGDAARARGAFAASLGLALGLGALISAGAVLFTHALLTKLGASAAIADMAAPYFRLTVGSTFLASFSLTAESALRAARNTRLPLLIATGVTVVKIALNALFIFGGFGLPAFGLAGAGAATLASQLLGVSMFLWVIRRAGLPESPAVRLVRADLATGRALLRETLRISWPAVGERVLISAAILIYFRALSGYGDASVAAYTIGVRLLAFSWTAPTGISIAASTLVGQALGASDARLAARSGWRAARLSVLVSLPLLAVFAVLRTTLAEIFTHDPAVIPQLESFMILLGLAQPFLSLHFTLSGALRGAGDTKTPLLSAIFGNWIFRVPLVIAVVSLHLPVVWVWGTVVFDHVTRAAWLTWSFRREAWARNLGVTLARAH
ncbi:MAG TPA: MATE family efflux transporter [Myxococcota bacterium]|nr:MATE family efflux transporter [Myxococcota bacterium]